MDGCRRRADRAVKRLLLVDRGCYAALRRPGNKPTTYRLPVPFPAVAPSYVINCPFIGRT